MQRRTLTFASLTDAVHEAEGMLANGYIKVGSWSLGQVCGELADLPDRWLPTDAFDTATGDVDLAKHDRSTAV